MNSTRCLCEVHAPRCDGRPRRWGAALGSRFLLALCLLAIPVFTGCQVDVGGQTLPSPYYLQDDIQYFPAGPEFKLSKEAAALKAHEEELAEDCDTCR